MSTKLYKLALNLNGLIPEVDDPYNLWRKIIELRKKYKDYFEGKDANFIINIFLMILSIRTTGNLDYYENIRDKVFFFAIFITYGDYHVENCDECDGNGTQSCEQCDGDGSEECDECDGSGHEECDECDGDGNIIDANGQEDECEECDGTGEKDCDNCEGKGDTTCGNCGGDGQITCNECDGRGELESDTEKDFSSFLYLSWSPTIKNIAELRQLTYQGISEDDFNDLSKKDVVLLGTEDFYGEPFDEVEDDVNYIYYFNDDLSKVSFSQSGLVLNKSEKGLRVYFQEWNWS